MLLASDALQQREAIVVNSDWPGGQAGVGQGQWPGKPYLSMVQHLLKHFEGNA
jgi:hypothetical protein